MYQQTGTTMGQFLEWRHKVILMFWTAIGLMFAITSWLFKEEVGGLWIAGPVFAGAVIAGMCTYLDRRNGMIIESAYKTAQELEMLLARPTLDMRGRFQ